jgi:hypothetical protein
VLLNVAEGVRLLVLVLVGVRVIGNDIELVGTVIVRSRLCETDRERSAESDLVTVKFFVSDRVPVSDTDLEGETDKKEQRLSIGFRWNTTVSK